jgi:hypothetical protein
MAEGDYVIVHGRFSGNGRPAAFIADDIVRIEDGKLAEHWDVLQEEATRAESKSGLQMFGNRFPVWAEKAFGGLSEPERGATFPVYTRATYETLLP